MVGRALAERWPDGERALRLLFHRSEPAIPDRRNVALRRVDLGSVDDLRRALDDAVIVIDLLRPTRDGWRHGVAQRLGDALAGSNVGRVLHVSSIDVYGATTARIVDADTPPEPVSDYAREHLAAERLAESRPVSTTVLRLGAVLGPGSQNLVALAREVAVAPAWRLAARRALSGTRRLHLVSLDTVIEALFALMASPGPPRRAVVTDDPAPENNFAYAQDRLISAFRRPDVSHAPVLPRAVLHAALALRGQPPALAYRRFAPPGLGEVDERSVAQFPARLSAYVGQLATGVVGA